MSLKASDIELGATYGGGKNGDRRTVVRWGSSEKWLCWAPTRERLPYGGFANTRCTGTAAFAKWATERLAD